jgi:hypothetical protein
VKKIVVDRFSLKKLNEKEVKEEYKVAIKNKFAALESLEDNVISNSSWDTNSQKIKVSAKESIGPCESKRHKPWFDEEFSKLVDGRKLAKLQWLQDPSEVNEDNLSNVRQETNRRTRNKKRECMIDRIKELESNSKKRTSETCIQA